MAAQDQDPGAICAIGVSEQSAEQVP